MSASREKKKRFEERADGVEKRQVRAKTNKKNLKRKRIITTAAVVVIVVLLVVAVVFNSNLFYTGVAALKVGSEKYTAADVNYEYYNTYYNTYSSIANTYGDYASLLLNPETPLDEQYYAEGVTWDDYFEEYAQSQLQQMTILTNAAKAEGWSLSSEQISEIDANIESLKSAAASNGYSDYRSYLRALYGKGITENRLRELLEKSYYATYYSQYLADTWMNSYTEDELISYYDGVRDEYDAITYMAYTVVSTPDDENGIDADAALDIARTTANEIAGAHDQVAFADAVRLYAPEEEKADYADDDACLVRYASPSGISNEEWKTWLTSQDRAEGDSTIISGTDSYTVLLFLDRCGNDYKMAEIRGITIQVATDEESGEVTDATRTEAENTVSMIMEAYNADPTEENFIELANTYDEAGVEDGLYSDVVLGQLAAAEVEAYIFADDTTVGDVRSFYSDGYYYVIYPMERGEQYNLEIAKNLMANDQYDTMMENAKADNPIETLFAYRFIK